MKSTKVTATAWARLLRTAFSPDRTGKRSRRPRVEQLEDRTAPSVDPGLTLSGPTPPTQNQLYDVNGNPATNAAFGFQTGTYQQPGSNGLAALPYADINNPYIVNFSSSATQPVQSSDWWSNLMFRLDPGSVQSPIDPSQQAQFAYGNNFLDSEPAIVRFTNDRFTDDQHPWRQGLSIYNPEALEVMPGPTGAAATTETTYGFTGNTPLTLGIGGTTNAQEITPLGVAGNHPANGTDENQLNVRVNSYSEWGVQVGYGDTTDSLTVNMLNGSPFTYFTKSSTAATPALAKLWLVGAPPPGVSQTVINVWLASGPELGVTITVVVKDASGVLRVNNTSYLIVAQSSQGTTPAWVLDNSQGLDPNAKRLYTNAMANGLIAVAVLPHFVGTTPFEQLAQADKAAVANLFAKVAFNVPTNTAVSSAVAHTETYDGQAMTFGYDPTTGLVRTRYTVQTATNPATGLPEPTYQILYPAQLKTLLPSDAQNLLLVTLSTGVKLPLAYTTPLGTAFVYASPTNSFATQLRYEGVLPSLPGVVAQTDAGAAEALFQDLSGWVQRYLPDPNGLFGPTDNTYETVFMQVGEQMQIADQLAAPTSLIGAGERALAAQWRDWMLSQLEQNLYSWFDPSTGRLFQYNSTYDTLIGYPAGFGSDFSINDHHFHYGYFLNAFATVAQYDPAFVQALLPQITLLVNDIADTNPADKQFPFLREFNPWAGHSWADGVGAGGNNEESASEAVNAWAGIEKLGELLGNTAWESWGAYMYQTEIESMNEYWFNTGADLSAGNSGNWPAAFAQYQLNGQPENVTQIANVNQQLMKRTLFFDSANQAEALYAINWLPVAPQSLYLGANQAYLQRNWAQFVQDYNTVGTPGVYEAVVAAYQALMPDGGSGLDQPGPDNALLRLDPGVNPAVVSPDPTLPMNNGYLGTSRTIVLDWIYTLRELGQVDTSVVANAPSYAAFIKDGQRSFVAYNPTGAPITVTFRDANSGQVMATLIVQPNQTVTQMADGSLITDEPGAGKATGAGQSLYLTKPLDRDPNNITGSLSPQPGTAVPDLSFGTGPLDLATYANDYVNVPKRNNAANNSNATPANAGDIASFTISNLNGSYIPGGSTGMDLFLDNALTFNGQANKAGPGVVQNQSFGSPFAVIEVDYYFSQSATQPSRVETYWLSLQSANQFYEANTLTTAAGPVAPNVPDVRPVLQPQASNLAPFQDMQNGKVTVRVWAGANAGGNANKEFAVAVNDVPQMARSSRVVIPYAAGTDPLTVVNATAVVPTDSRTTNPARSAVDAVNVLLSGPAKAGSFAVGALTLTHNGTAVPLNGTVIITPTDNAGAYQVSGLAPFQNGSGTYVLTVNAAKIENLAGAAGSGSTYVSWTLDMVAPAVTLYTSTPAGGTASTPGAVTVLFSEPVTGFTLGDVQAPGAALSNLRGAGGTYTFDVTPTTGQAVVTVQVQAGAAQDAAGNASLASNAVKFSLPGQPLAPVVSSPAAPITSKPSAEVSVVFPESVTGFTASDILVNNGTVTNFGGSGTTYSFQLQPLTPATSAPQTVTVTIPAGAAEGAGGHASTAAAPFARTFDSSPLTGMLLSTSNQVTSAALIPVTVQFNKPVTGFTESDLTVANALVAPGSFQGGGSLYFFNLIPVSMGPLSVAVAAGKAADAAGNVNQALAPLTRVFQPQPSVSVFTTGGNPTSADPIPVFVSFGTPPVNFDQSKLTAVGATVSGFSQLAATLFTAQLAPSGGPITAQVLPLLVKDVFGNLLAGSNTLTLYSGPAPTLTSSTPSGDINTGPVHVHFQLSTLVTGLDATKLRTQNAVVTSFLGGGNVYDFDVSPLGPGEVKVVLPAGGAESTQLVPNASDITLFDTNYSPATPVTRAVLTTSSLLQTSVTPLLFTASFNPAAPGLTASAVRALLGTVTDFQTADGGKTYTFQVAIPQGTTVPATVTVWVNPNVSGLNPISDTLNINLHAQPTVVAVKAGVSDGTYGVGALIPIQVQFSGPVTVTGNPQLTLATGGGLNNAVLNYAGGTGTDTLTFNYTVAPGQNSARLDYLFNQALALNGAIKDGGGNLLAHLVLPDPGAPGSLGFDSNIAVSTSPQGTHVANVSTTAASPASYPAGASIAIQVRFSDPVTVDTTNGVPGLRLNSGGVATYGGGSGTNVLTFNYTVQPGDSSALLDYAATDALVLRGGTIKDGGGNDANLTLPAPGAAGSLESNAALTVRGTSPRVISFGATVRNATNPNQIDNATNVTFGAGKAISIAINFSDVVKVTGAPQLLLNTTGGPPAVATYASGSGTSQLVFTYTTAAGQSTPQLDYTSRQALQLNGGTLTDISGMAFVPELPQPGSAGSLSSTNKIAIAADAPQVVSVYSSANATFGLGEGVLINVTFNRPVQLSAGQASLLLNTTPDSTNHQQGVATTPADLDLTAFRTTYQFTYIVLAGQNTPQLDYRDVNSLVLASGASFVDAYGNTASLALAAPGTAGSLGASNRITIRSDTTTPPVVSGVSATVPNGTYGVGQTIPITVTFSGKVVVSTAGGTPQLTLALANGQSVAVNYSGGSGTNTLTFNYTVAAGQNSPQLAYASAGALALHGGSINDAATGAAATLALPTPGTVGSLSGARKLVIDTTTPAPHVLRVQAAVPDGVYRTGSVIRVQVVFSGPVVVAAGKAGERPQLLLAAGPGGQTVAATYVTGSGTSTLTFQFTVTAGQSTPLLGYASSAALQLVDGATIRDARSTRDAVLTLPDPGLDGSLSASSLIVLNLPAQQLGATPGSNPVPKAPPVSGAPHPGFGR